jgi:hypothetical protein
MEKCIHKKEVIKILKEECIALNHKDFSVVSRSFGVWCDKCKSWINDNGYKW